MRLILTRCTLKIQDMLPRLRMRQMIVHTFPLSFKETYQVYNRIYDFASKYQLKGVRFLTKGVINCSIFASIVTILVSIVVILKSIESILLSQYLKNVFTCNCNTLEYCHNLIINHQISTMSLLFSEPPGPISMKLCM